MTLYVSLYRLPEIVQITNFSLLALPLAGELQVKPANTLKPSKPANPSVSASRQTVRVCPYMHEQPYSDGTKQ